MKEDEVYRLKTLRDWCVENTITWYLHNEKLKQLLMEQTKEL